ncbi:MAG: methyltransferase domain-containing protein [Methanoregulaceae archaeon]
MYCWNPADYLKNSPAQKAWAEELVEKLRLTGTERVLDIGCGDGKVTAEIAARVPGGAAAGIDSSDEMIRFARENYPETRFPNLSFTRMDMREIRLPGTFDIAFSNAAMHWVLDHRPVLAGIRASLRTGGRLLFQMGGKGNATRVFATLGVLMETERWKPYFTDFEEPYYFPGPEEYSELLVEAGFSPRRAELIPKTMTYPDAEGFLGWMRTTWLPYTSRLPEELRPVFLSDALETYLAEYPPDPDGSIRVPMVRFEIEAIRDF